MNVSQRGNNAEVRDTFALGSFTLTAARLDESPFGIMAELSFNVDHGYLEGLVRGMKAGILTCTDYHNLAQCDTLEGKNIVSHCHFWTLFSFANKAIPEMYAAVLFLKNSCACVCGSLK